MPIYPSPKNVHQILATARSNGRRLTRPNALFRPEYHPTYAPSLFHAPPSSPVSKAALLLTSPRAVSSRRGLALNVGAGKTVSPKAVVRNWSKRRMEEAVRAAMVGSGFSREGLAVRGGGERDLRGSLVVRLQAGVVGASWEELREEAGKLVEGLRRWRG